MHRISKSLQICTANTIRMLQDFGLEDGIPFTPYWESIQSRKFIMSLLETRIATAITTGDLDISTTLGRMHALGAERGLLPDGKEATLLAQEAVVLMFAGVMSAALLHMLSDPWSWPIAHLCQPHCAKLKIRHYSILISENIWQPEMRCTTAQQALPSLYSTV